MKYGVYYDCILWIAIVWSTSYGVLSVLYSKRAAIKQTGPTVMMTMDHNRGMNLGGSNIGALASGR